MREGGHPAGDPACQRGTHLALWPLQCSGWQLPGRLRSGGSKAVCVAQDDLYRLLSSADPLHMCLPGRYNGFEGVGETSMQDFSEGQTVRTVDFASGGCLPRLHPAGWCIGIVHWHHFLHVT